MSFLSCYWSFKGLDVFVIHKNRKMRSCIFYVVCERWVEDSYGWLLWWWWVKIRYGFGVVSWGCWFESSLVPFLSFCLIVFDVRWILWWVKPCFCLFETRYLTWLVVFIFSFMFWFLFFFLTLFLFCLFWIVLFYISVYPLDRWCISLNHFYLIWNCDFD